MESNQSRDPSHPAKRPWNVHPTHDEVRESVTVEIPGHERGQIGGTRKQSPRRETLTTVVLQPDQAWKVMEIPLGIEAGGGDIEVSIAIQITSDGTIAAGHLRKFMSHQHTLPVFQPAQPMVWLRKRDLVHHISVGPEKIEVTIFVQIDR